MTVPVLITDYMLMVILLVCWVRSKKVPTITQLVHGYRLKPNVVLTICLYGLGALAIVMLGFSLINFKSDDWTYMATMPLVIITCALLGHITHRLCLVLTKGKQ